ncbi:efflux RND transporter periplasmic adaptor subunit [Bacillus sp. ISL-40]|uniref:efflux RND transporter periplasmic adaptor subunit n=1 Tax=unclassified Bacillus (in: firmicutes) TaxID=185979 RepID=UPI001BEC0815|nr:MULTISPECIES: efflux RND transporter periplasmic adaptor subunit [unclassified Bacillus (in: firmicutes)]MBT2700688.1 efflux RND transporter periplasmic adaptor subunit [Bacillus sp. ISL-40]MBT2744463.1 efflux RND transporter periplasmic adaptor subunit [Bacillus sp. ISL-77]
MKKKTWIALGVISLVIIMISVSVYRQVFAKGPSVKTAEISQEEISSLLMIPGTVKLPEEQLVYATPDKGEIKELLVKEGQIVKKGTVLAKLQNAQLELEIEQNKLSIQSANLKISQIDKKIEQLEEKEKTLSEQAGVGKKEAKKQLAPEFEQLEMEKELANIELKQTEVQKDLISKRQGDLEIKSTMDGIVLAAKKPVSSSIEAANEPIIHIGKLEGMTASGLLSEYDTLKVSGGQKVIIRSDAVPGKEWQGVITKTAILPEQNPTSLQNGTQAVQYPVTVKISGDTKTLKPGFQVIMEIETDKKTAMVLPLDALFDDGDKPYVYLVKDGKANKENVKTGITSGKKIEILEGVSKGDQVIINGPDNIKDGLEVTIK